MTNQILKDTFDEIENELSVLRRLAFAAIEESAAKEELLCKGVRLVHEGRLHQVTKMENDAGKEFRAALKIVGSFYPDKVAEAKAKAERPHDADAA